MKIYQCIIALVFVIIILNTLASAISDSIDLDEYNIDYSYDEAEAGEKFSLEVEITNTDNVNKTNVVMELDFDNPFDSDEDKIEIDFLEPGETVTETFRVEVDEDADSDDYDIDFTLEDDDEDYDDAFEIEVESNKAELIIGNINSIPTTITPDTEDIKLTITIENKGDNDAEFVKAKLRLPQGFTPSNSYSDIASLGTIEAGMNKEAVFYIDSDENIEGKRHISELLLEYESNDNDFEDVLEFDIPVKGKPQFKITSIQITPKDISGGMEGKITLTIQNIGQEEGEETSIKVFESSDIPIKFSEKTRKIGSINPGITGSAVFDFEVENNADTNMYLVKIQTRTVNNGNVLVEDHIIEIPVKESKRSITPLLFFLTLAIIIVLIVIIYIYKKPKKKK